MKFLRTLVLSNLLARKARAALTICAIMLAVSLVVAVTTGYNSVQQGVRKYLNKYLGSIDAQVSRQNDPRGAVTERVIDALDQDPQVLRADGRLELQAGVIDSEGKALEGRYVVVMGINRPRDTRIEDLVMEQGAFFDTNTGDVCVIDQALADRLKEKVGDSVSIPEPPGRKLTLKIVGVVHKPEVMAAAVQSMYVPLRTLQHFHGWDRPPEGYAVNHVMIELHKGIDPHDFEAKFTPVLKQIDSNLKLHISRDTRATIDRQLAVVDLLTYLGGTVSMLAATFIVFSALSMGVTERQRTLAMLRAVGAFRTQIGLLVVAEGLLLASVGGVLGVPLGWLWVKVLTLIFSDIFPGGVFMNWLGAAYGVLGTIAAALAASLLPAWWATCVSPLDAMTPDAAPPSSRTPVFSALFGLLLMSLDPLPIMGPIPELVTRLGIVHSDAARNILLVYFHLFIGLPTLMIGAFLLAPMLVLTVDRIAGPVVAVLFRINYRLLRQQLSNGLWRAAGTCAALMVGLAVLIALEVQGNSALRGWRLPTKFPDIFIVSPTGGLIGQGGLDFNQAKALEAVPGIRHDEIMPIAIASPQFGSSMFSFAMAAMNPEATMFFGIDPRRAFKMMELEFRDGNVTDAQRILVAGKQIKLADGEALYGTVTESGDNLSIIDLFGRTRVIPRLSVALRPDGGLQQIAMKDGRTLAGIVTVVKQAVAATQPTTQRTGLGSLLNMLDSSHPATESVDAYDVEPLDDNSVVTRVQTADLAKPIGPGLDIQHGRFLLVTNEFKQLKHLGVGSDFPLKNTTGQVENYKICGVVWSPGIDVIVSVFDMGRQFDQQTAASVFGTVEDARRDFGTQRIYLFAANLEYGVEREPLMKQIKESLRVDGMKAGDVRHIKDMILKSLYRLIHLTSVMAYAAMAVASLGVTNTVMAGIRTRKWQFGVLRSVGVTRGQLLRMVLAESVLLGIAAIILGVVVGGLMARDGYQLNLYNTGYDPGIVVPWVVIGIGILAVLIITTVATLGPAIGVSRAEPLELLQEGRAAT